MKPLYLQFSAFGPYADEVILDFADLSGRTFFLIHGPTGAGKTTILDAICFALYGDASGALRDGRTMRSDHAGIEVLTEVTFTFAVGQAIYKVRRAPEQQRAKKRGDGVTVSPADAQLYEIKGEEEKLIGHGYSKVTEKIEALLGFRSNQFRQVVLLPQGEFRKLLTANSAERQEIMQTLFKTELYRQIEESLKQKAKAIEQGRTTLAEQNRFLLHETGEDDLAALAAKIQEESEAAQSLDGRLKVLDKVRQQTQQAVIDGRLLESKFLAAKQAEEEVVACKALEPKVDEFRQIYLRAEKAAQLEDAETQLDVLKKDLDEYAAAAEIQGRRATELALKVKAAERLLTAEESRRDEREAAERKVAELEGFVQKIAHLETAKAAETEARREAELDATRRQAGEKALLDAAASLKEKQLSLQGLTAEAAKADLCRMELEQLKRHAEAVSAAELLIKEVEKAEKKTAQAKEALIVITSAYEVQQKRVLQLQHLFAEGQAAILAKGLCENKPCPVCGSMQHPRPAQSEEILPSEQEVKEAQAELAVLDEKRRHGHVLLQKGEVECAALRSRIESACDAFGGAVVDSSELREKIAVANRQLMAAEAATAKLQAEEEEIRYLQTLERECTEKLGLLQNAQREAESLWKASLAVVAERGAALPEVYRDRENLARARRTAKESQQRLNRNLEEARKNTQLLKESQAVASANAKSAKDNLERTQERYTIEAAQFAARLAKAGFIERAVYQAAKQKPEYRKTLAERLKHFDDRFVAAKQTACQTAQAVAGLIAPDLVKLEQATQETAAEYNQNYAAQLQLKERIAKRREQQQRLLALAEKISSMDSAYGVIGTLAEIANGKNAHGLTFQRFVLKSLLEDVIDASNLRLKMMSRGQYALQSTDERARKNAAGGLELEVFDHYTGYARPVTTLSGGETFLASLSLALGLADVVQSYAGGTRLDTILVDEGFGTLDPESLDIAMRALVDLQKGGRLVGIISHVPELQERIDARLTVTKGKHGSTARFAVGSSLLNT